MSGIFDAPMEHGPMSVQVGTDELGRPIYRTVLGNIVGDAMQGQAPENRLARILRTELDPQGRSIHRIEELQPTRTGNALASLAQGILQGFTAPGRAARGEAVTLGDVWATALDNGAIAAPMPAPRGAIRAGAMASQSPADEIAAMLRSGRAADITDDMMARLAPEDNVRLFRLYEEGATGQPMPMDEASRMARAREMGFDPDTALYHGTGADFPAFSNEFAGGRQGASNERAIFLSTSPDVASEFSAPLAEWPVQSGAVIQAVGPERRMPIDFDGNYYNAKSMDLALTAGRRAGVDAIETRNLLEALGLGVPQNAPQAAVFDPRNIRSRFARFDPRMSHLAHLSAGGAGVAVLGGQDGEASGWESARQYLREIGALE